MKGFNPLNQTNQEVQVMLRIALCDDDFNFIFLRPQIFVQNFYIEEKISDGVADDFPYGLH